MKKIVIIIFTLLLILQASILSVAAQSQGKSSADALYSLHLIKGLSNEIAEYGLEKTLTRAEAVVMMVRFLGDEYTALNSIVKRSPFSDVPDWASKFVDYAYSIGFISGKVNHNGALYLGADEEVTETEFLTFMLRILGYDDSKGDFVWDNPHDLARTTGIYEALNSEEIFLRANAMQICYAALEASKKGETDTLASHFIQDKLFTENEYEYAKKLASIRWNAPEDMRIVLISDIHYLLSADSPRSLGVDNIERMEKMIETLNAENQKKPIDFCIINGDLMNISSSGVATKVEDLKTLANDFLSRLDMPWFAIRGNHDCYSDEEWYSILGNPPQLAIETDNYVFMLIDTYGDYENGQLHGGADLAYSGVDVQIDWVKEQINYAKAADKYAFAIYHYFNEDKDTLWLDILKNENTVAGQARGHTHVVMVRNDYNKVVIGTGNFGPVPVSGDKTYKESNASGFKILEQRGEELVTYHVYANITYPRWPIYQPETGEYIEEPFTKEYTVSSPFKIKLPIK